MRKSPRGVAERMRREDEEAERGGWEEAESTEGKEREVEGWGDGLRASLVKRSDIGLSCCRGGSMM